MYPSTPSKASPDPMLKSSLLLPWIPIACMLVVTTEGDRLHAAQSQAPYASAYYPGLSIPVDAQHEGQQLHVFRPDDAVEGELLPAVVFLENSGWVKSIPKPTLSPDNSLEWRFLQEGFVVVTATCTVARGGESPNAPDTPEYDPERMNYGPAYCGNGMFHPPEFLLSPPYQGCPGKDYSMFPHVAAVPFDDPHRPMPEKDAVMIIQHLKHLATDYGIDKDRLTVWGGSGSAITWMWAALGPDRRDTWDWNPDAKEQELEDTRVFAAILFQGGTYWHQMHEHFTPHPDQGSWHFPKESDPDPDYLYDIPSKYLDLTFQDHLTQDSALVYGLEGDTRDDNRIQSLYLQYDEPADVEGLTGPLDFDFTSTYYEDNIVHRDRRAHTAWSGHAWVRQFPSAFLATTLAGAYYTDGTPVAEASPLPNAVPVPDRIAPSNAAIEMDQVEWLKSLVAADWRMEDYTIEGLHGAPSIHPRGTLSPGGDFQVMVSRARPNSSAYLLLSLGEVFETPVFGGVTLTNTGRTLLQLPNTDGNGRTQVTLTLPAIAEAGATLRLQSFIFDEDAIANRAMTHIVRSVIQAAPF